MPEYRAARNWTAYAALAVIGITLAAVFVLPWFVPVGSALVVSDSQAVGFSNRTAMLGLAGGAFCLAVLGLASRRNQREPSSKPILSLTAAPLGQRIGTVLVVGFSVASAVVVLVLGAIYREYPLPGEGAYFINAILLMTGNGAKFASVFSYGPLLLFPPILVARIVGIEGVRLIYAYYVWVALCFAAAPPIYAYVLNRLQISPKARTLVFVVMSVHGITLARYLGAATTALRCMLPVALLLWAMAGVLREPRRASNVVYPLLAVVIGYGVSPEMGLALMVALTAVLAVSAAGKGRATQWTTLLVFLALSSAGIWAQRALSASSTLGDFAGGAFYLPVLPSVYSLLYVAALLLIAFHTGKNVNLSLDGISAAHVGLLVLSVAYVASAFGRADWGHIFGSGLGALLAAGAVLNQRWRKDFAYFAVVLGVFVGAHMYFYIPGVPVIAPLAFERGVWSDAISEKTAVALARVGGHSPETGREWWRSARQTLEIRQNEMYSVAVLPEVAFLDPYAVDFTLYMIQYGDLAHGYLDPGGALNLAYYRLASDSLKSASTIVIPASTYSSYL